MRSTPRASLLVWLAPLLVVALLLPGQRAAATTHERVSSPLSLRTSAPVGPAGNSLLVSGTGFSAGERVDLYVGVRAAGSVTATADGAFTGFRITVPAATPPGEVAVLANGRYSRFTAQASYLVQSNWSRFGRDAAHTASNPDENVVGPGNVAGLTPHGGFGLDTGPAAPVVANGSIYYAAGDGSGLSAFRASPGGVSWNHPDNAADNGSTIATPTRVFYQSGSEVQALDARSGNSLWRTSFGSAGSTDSVSAIGYGDGAVYAVVKTDYRHSLVRLSAVTGAVVWTVSGTYEERPPAVADGVVYARDGDAVEAIDTTDGSRLWTTIVPATETGLLAVSGTVLVTPFRYGLAALDRASGKILWHTAAGITGDVALAGDRLVGNYFDFATGDVRLTALDLRTGATLWRTDDFYGSPVIANGVVYTGYGQKLYAVDLATGKALATLDLPEQDPNSLPYLDAPVAVVDGVVYVPLQYYGNRFEGAGIYRLTLPDRDGVPAVRSVDDTVTGSGQEQIGYAGGWVAGSRPGAYQDTFHYARSTGATASTTFTGVGARLWYSTGPGFGRVTVSIDGVPVVTLDQGSSVRRDGVKSWTSGALAAGRHTLVVRAAAASVVDVDRVDIGTF